MVDVQRIGEGLGQGSGPGQEQSGQEQLPAALVPGISEQPPANPAPEAGYPDPAELDLPAAGDTTPAPGAEPMVEAPVAAAAEVEQTEKHLDSPNFIEYIKKWAETNGYDPALLEQDRQLRDMAGGIDIAQQDVNSLMGNIVRETNPDRKSHLEQLLIINTGFLDGQKKRFGDRYKQLTDAQHQEVAEVPVAATVQPVDTEAQPVNTEQMIRVPVAQAAAPVSEAAPEVVQPPAAAAEQAPPAPQ